MLNHLLEYLKNMVKSKLFPMIVVFIVLFSILIGRMFFLQILHGEELNKIAVTKTSKSRDIISARGKIYDCNGKLLAANVQSYGITIADSGEFTNSTQKNIMIAKCISIIESNGDKLVLDFPLAVDKKGKIVWTVEPAAQLRFKQDIFYKTVSQLTKQQKSMSPSQIFDYLLKDERPARFNIGTAYDKKMAIKIMTIRYALLMSMYKKYIPITISSNVSPETIAGIKENISDMPGVEVAEELKREYYDSQYFAHIIGYTGLISSDALALKKEADPNTTYSLSDQIGKTGIEAEYEDLLKGKKGKENLVLDDSYRIVSVSKVTSPVVGNDIYLTLDSELQKAYYNLLEKKLAGILYSKLNNSTDAGTKGKSATNIRVPIYDVYNAIIQNNLVNVDQLNTAKSSSLEKNIYHKFTSKKSSTSRKINNELRYSNTRHGSEISETMQDYLDYVYKLLIDQEMVLKNSIDKSDPMYINYIAEKISMSKFLRYAISKNWVNLDLLDIGDSYYSTEEIYKKLIRFTMTQLKEDNEYFKRIYHELIYDFSISGREVCLLLYEQGVLNKKDPDYKRLKSSSIDAYSFIRKKIRTLRITPGQLGLEPCSGSIVVTDVKTGKVKAMVSYPSYDNNKFANSVDSEYFAKINSNKAAPLINRATKQNTAPGSTYKMLTGITALEEGVINPFSTVLDKTVFSKIGPQAPKCWSSSSHGNINISQALQVSCNYFFYEMGYRLSNGKKDYVNNDLGLGKLKKYAKKFGLDAKSGVELEESEPNVSDTDAIRSAIGQGTNSYTPVQLSRYVTTIANRGTSFNLTLVDKINYVSQKKIKKNKAKVHNTLSFADSTWNAISSGMKRVVEAGSIRALFRNSPVKVAGKTGTAQESTSKANHALFVSYAPYNDPEISVTTVIANGYTSSNAAELASDIYMYYYKKSSRKKINNQKVSVPRLDTRAFSD